MWFAIMDKEISEFIEKHKKKIIIFVGITSNMANDDYYYLIPADYRFFINIKLADLIR